MGLGLGSLITAAVIKADSSTVLPGAVGDGIDVATETGDHDSNIKQLAENLYGDHVFAFQLTSVLLVVAVAGTVVLTRKWPKADVEDTDASLPTSPGAAK
jgi:NADH-quinone oxidoreductase subunit J